MYAEVGRCAAHCTAAPAVHLKSRRRSGAGASSQNKQRNGARREWESPSAEGRGRIYRSLAAHPPLYMSMSTLLSIKLSIT